MYTKLATTRQPDRCRQGSETSCHLPPGQTVGGKKVEHLLLGTLGWVEPFDAHLHTTCPAALLFRNIVQIGIMEESLDILLLPEENPAPESLSPCSFTRVTDYDPLWMWTPDIKIPLVSPLTSFPCPGQQHV